MARRANHAAAQARITQVVKGQGVSPSIQRWSIDVRFGAQREFLEMSVQIFHGDIRDQTRGGRDK
jgi:hypothetical protein